MQDFIGKHIDRYRIDAEQGVGGMAVVYKAFDTRLEREVALKLIRTEQIPPVQLDRILERFRREAKNLAKLTDVPGVVTLLDYGVHEQKPYLVMSYLPGGTLKDRLGSPMEPLAALRQLTPIVEALEIIHGMDIIHRDIKPSNLLVNRFGQLALADFGIAKAFESDDVTLTGTGMGVGTPEYMAPEQWTGKTVIQSDIYALGVVYYEMITGKKPYEADTASELFLKIMTQPLQDPRTFSSEIPEAVSQFLQRCMARELDKRTSSVKTMLGEIQTLLKPPVESNAVVTPVMQKRVEPPVIKVAHQPADNETWDAIEESARAEVDGHHGVPAPEEHNQEKIRRVYLSSTVAMTFVRIPAGTFLMGAREEDLNAEDDEKPQRRVFLDEYWIGQTPVTNQQYGVYSASMGFTHWYQPEKADQPVVNVTWFDAKSFCQWLSEKYHEAIELPTEAEWEKAARGVDGRIYPWGNQKPTLALANFDRNNNHVMAVGSFPDGASPYGVLDMAGNIWELVADWYDESYYLISPDKNPPSPAEGENRVARGGAWDLGGPYLRASYRDWANPEYKFKDMGFRCVIKTS